MDIMVAAYLAASLPVALRWACLVISSLLLAEIASLLLLDQVFVYDWHPSPQFFVEFVFCSVILDCNVFVVELRVRDALVLIELVNVCRKGEHLRYMGLLGHDWQINRKSRANLDMDVHNC